MTGARHAARHAALIEALRRRAREGVPLAAPAPAAPSQVALVGRVALGTAVALALSGLGAAIAQALVWALGEPVGLSLGLLLAVAGMAVSAWMNERRTP